MDAATSDFQAIRDQILNETEVLNPPPNGPTNVEVQFHILHLYNLDITDQTITVCDCECEWVGVIVTGE